MPENYNKQPLFKQMKQHLLLLVFALFTAALSAQTSSVYLQNNTNLDFGISAVQSGTHIMSPGEWTLLATDMYPWEMQKEILNTNRNSGVHNGETFYFDIFVWHGSDTFVMQLKLNGNFIGSTMDYSLKGNGFNHAWFNNSGFHQESLTFGGLPVTIKYKPDGTDIAWSRNIVFAIHHDTVPYIIDAADFSNPNVINVLSYNVQFLPFGISGLAFAAERGSFIPTELSPYQDVVIVQEAFDDNPRNNNLIPAMTAAGFPHRTGILNNDQFPIWNGGVMIFSRWPIEFTDEYDYRNCDNNAADCLAAKGIMYARINKLGKKYHIFGTHVEAGGNANDIAIKKEQFGEQRDFIASQNIPVDEAVILGGDMNTDAASVQYPDLVDSLNPIIGLHKGFYASTAVDRDSGNIIDHVWGHREHLVPVDCYTKVFIYRTIADAMFGIFDPSDHLPTNGRFEYPDMAITAPPLMAVCDTIFSPLTLTAPGHPLQSYQWYLNGNLLLGATNSTYNNPAPTISDTGQYSCVITTQFTVEDTTVLGHPNWPDTATQVFNYPITNFIYTPIEMNPTITQVLDTLFSSSPTGNQWYDANGPIAGAIANFYVMPPQGGSYYVVVSAGTCSSNNSNTINWVGVERLANQNYFKFYPNPAKDNLTIESSMNGDYSIEIMDATGRLLLQKRANQKLTELSLSGFAAGIYWVKLVNEAGAFVAQLMVR